MEVRPATSEDLSALQALAQEAWGFTYRNIYSAASIYEFIEEVYTQEFHNRLLDRVAEGTHFLDVLVIDGAVSGIASVDLNDRGAHLTRLYLRPNLIGQGHGSRLLSCAEGRVRSVRMASLDLLVHKENRLGIDFYERKGFNRFAGIDDEPEGELGYRKSLG